MNVPGPVELWALTTSPRDAALRERLHARLAPADARAALARRFPAGTARDWIEAELRRLELRGARVAASESGLLERLADELAQDKGTPRSGDTTRNGETPRSGGTPLRVGTPLGVGTPRSAAAGPAGAWGK